MLEILNHVEQQIPLTFTVKERSSDTSFYLNNNNGLGSSVSDVVDEIQFTKYVDTMKNDHAEDFQDYATYTTPFSTYHDAQKFPGRVIFKHDSLQHSESSGTSQVEQPQPPLPPHQDFSAGRASQATGNETPEEIEHLPAQTQTQPLESRGSKTAKMLQVLRPLAHPVTSMKILANLRERGR